MSRNDGHNRHFSNGKKETQCECSIMTSYPFLLLYILYTLAQASKATSSHRIDPWCFWDCWLSEKCSRKMIFVSRKISKEPAKPRSYYKEPAIFYEVFQIFCRGIKNFWQLLIQKWKLGRRSIFFLMKIVISSLYNYFFAACRILLFYITCSSPRLVESCFCCSLHVDQTLCIPAFVFLHSKESTSFNILGVVVFTLHMFRALRNAVFAAFELHMACISCFYTA